MSNITQLEDELTRLHEQRQAAIDLLYSVNEASGPTLDVYNATLASLPALDAAIADIEEKLNPEKTK